MFCSRVVTTDLSFEHCSAYASTVSTGWPTCPSLLCPNSSLSKAAVRDCLQIFSESCRWDRTYDSRKGTPSQISVSAIFLSERQCPFTVLLFLAELVYLCVSSFEDALEHGNLVCQLLHCLVEAGLGENRNAGARFNPCKCIDFGSNIFYESLISGFRIDNYIIIRHQYSPRTSKKNIVD